MAGDTCPAPSHGRTPRASALPMQLSTAENRVTEGNSAVIGTNRIWGNCASHAPRSALLSLVFWSISGVVLSRSAGNGFRGRRGGRARVLVGV